MGEVLEVMKEPEAGSIQTAPLAAPARAILVKVHVGINSAENTVLLPYTFHRRLHTTAVGSIRRQRS